MGGCTGHCCINRFGELGVATPEGTAHVRIDYTTPSPRTISLSLLSLSLFFTLSRLGLLLEPLPSRRWLRFPPYRTTHHALFLSLSLFPSFFRGVLFLRFSFFLFVSLVKKFYSSLFSSSAFSLSASLSDHPSRTPTNAFSLRCLRGTPLGYFQAICFVNARNLGQVIPPARLHPPSHRLPRNLRPPRGRDPPRMLALEYSNSHAVSSLFFSPIKKGSRYLIFILLIWRIMLLLFSILGQSSVYSFLLFSYCLLNILLWIFIFFIFEYRRQWSKDILKK